jgi:1-acyl-sn-glycerol-3-phosphate acyltransferase
LASSTPLTSVSPVREKAEIRPGVTHCARTSVAPAGTRVDAGTRPPLASGFAGLYKILKLTVVPVAVDSGKAWPKAFIKRPGVVTFRLMPPIEPGLAREDIETRVHTAINSLQVPARH